jgi:hypothetical protein
MVIRKEGRDKRRNRGTEGEGGKVEEGGLCSLPARISLWPAISFSHFFFENCSPKLWEMEWEATSWPSEYSDCGGKGSS